jgi:hypothetical protein
MINNNTGVEQIIQWGSKQLTLQPGTNAFRYDGELDSSGMPSVRPSDFSGTLITDANGRKALVANLDNGIEKGVKWGTPPVLSPTAPIASPATDAIEILSAPTATTPGTMAIRHPNGATSLVGIPTGGAVISNPTVAKPAQTTSNTTTNITNNTTNNTQTTSTTVINNDGTTTAPGSDVGPDTSAVNGITPPSDPSSDSVPTTNLQATTDRIKSSQTLGLARIQSKLTNFDRILAVESIPKTMVFTHTLALGQFGTFPLNIDFTKTPFPQVRLASVMVLTLVVGMAFMKRITI